MAPQYKLTYFNVRGRGEPIRFLFLYGGIEFEDNRIEIADWPKVKDTVPNGKVPVLETEGRAIGQSVAICRFVAKKVGLAGANDLEALQIDATVDTIVDTMTPLSQYFWETPDAEKPEKRDSLFKEHVPNYFGSLEKQVKENGGYLVNGKLTYADIYIAALSETLNFYVGKDLFADYPNLRELVRKVYDIQKIKAWIEKRPKTDL